ncbi:MAG: competence protein ComEA [Gaiellales bacterium]|nr:competence protein ComEA [Gaiellales bacterium]
MQFDRRLVLVLLLGGGAALVLAGRFLPSAPAPAPDLAPVVSLSTGGPSAPGDSARGPVVVHVVGAVRHPGVYRMAAGSRARDAVRRAGGAGPRADLGSVNLAALLADGEQVHVPSRVRPGGATATGSRAPAPAAVVHLNGASADDLDSLDGIGPALAERIVAYRVAHGGFRSVDELDEVTGIGPVRLEALRPRLAL